MGKHGRIKDTRLDRGGPSADLSQAKTGGHSRRRTVFRLLSYVKIHWLRSDVYQHIELLPVGVFDKSHSGDLVSRLVSDTTEVENFMEEDVAGFVSNAVTVAGALGLLFLVDRRLTLLVAPACVVLV